MPVRPDSYYGVSKCFGEALGRYYVDAFGLSVICLRIGSFQPRPRGERQLATWISYRDTAQLVWRGIESDLPFGIFYGISGNTRAYWDIANARELLGYAPEDDAETHAAEVLAEQAAQRAAPGGAAPGRLTASGAAQRARGTESPGDRRARGTESPRIREPESTGVRADAPGAGARAAAAPRCAISWSATTSPTAWRSTSSTPSSPPPWTTSTTSTWRWSSPSRAGGDGAVVPEIVLTRTVPGQEPKSVRGAGAPFPLTRAAGLAAAALGRDAARLRPHQVGGSQRVALRLEPEGTDVASLLP